MTRAPAGPESSDVLSIGHYIDGRIEPAGAARLPVVEPATGAVYAEVADATAADVERAVAAAERAFPDWGATPARERARWLERLADAVEAHAGELARDESRDTGKPLSLAERVDIPRAVANLRFFAGAIQHESWACYATDRAAFNWTLRRPRSVAGLISPWNLPLYLLTWKIAPALAAGATAVAKPSELTPLTAYRLAHLASEIGLPAGVLNIVHGRGAGAGVALVEHPAVRTISFTGGTATGADIARRAAPAFKRFSLELGGKNPTLVFADADLDRALDGAVRAAFSNQGQICLCGSRLLVERSIHDAFVERFTAAARRLVVGDPLEPATDQGALISAAHRDKVAGFVEAARREGAEILCGGGPPDELPERCRDGFFYAPTVIAGVAPDAAIACEEVFGPVVTVHPFADEDEAVALANRPRYGLAASLFTRDLQRAHRVAARLECGTVWIDGWMARDLRVPFGGAKQSGIGREGGWEALRFFTEPKTVCLVLEEGP